MLTTYKAAHFAHICEFLSRIRGLHHSESRESIRRRVDLKKMSAAIPTEILARKYELVVAVDVGTHGTGICLAFPTVEATSSDQKAMDSLTFLRPGSLHLRADTGKEPTVLLLHSKRGHELTFFGRRALEAMTELPDNAVDDPDSEGLQLFRGFKMDLAPTKEGRASAAEDIVSKPAAVVHPGGPTSGGALVPVQLLMQRVFEYVKDQVAMYLSGRCSSGALKTLWVITVPAIWDDVGKHVMRQAAAAAGLVRDANSSDLMLVLEPECAVFSAVVDRMPTEADTFPAGSTVMIVDCGGGTLDITIESVECERPLALRELQVPRGGPWGARDVDAEFMAFIDELFGPELCSKLMSAGRLMLVQSWESEKLSIDGEHHRMVSININTSTFTCERAELATLLAAGITKYNEEHGLTDAEEIKLTKSLKLQIPGRIAASFFTKTLDAIIGHVGRLMDEFAASGRTIDVIALAGGFAESAFLRSRIQAAFAARCSRIVMPQHPGRAVCGGAALHVLRPAPVRSRIMPYSYGYQAVAPFDPKIHDARHKVSYDGREMCHIIVPFVQRGEEVPPEHVVRKPGLPPTRNTQVVMDFKIFRSEDEIVDNKKHPTKPSTVPLAEGAEPGLNNGIPDQPLAQVTVHIGNEGRPRLERMVDLEFTFGAEGIIVRAASHGSADSKEVTLAYT